MTTALDESEAIALHREITEHIVTIARAFCTCDRSARAIEVRFSGGNAESMRSWLGTGITFSPQNGGDIGDRTRKALRDAFSDGADFAVIIGTDCPGLTVSLLEEAFSALHLNDVVIGPSTNGSYYLIGIRAQARLTAIPALFKGIAWGTGFVYGDTISILKRLGLSYTVLETLTEIDTPEDLPVWEKIKTAITNKQRPPMISVIIPTLNNAALIDHTLDSIETATDIEVIIADSGSIDDTVVKAITRGAHAVESLPERVHQLNAGAREATGQYLLFLNPGTVLEPGFDHIIRNTLADMSTACGAFSLEVDSPGSSRRITDIIATIHSTVTHPPYVNQSLFLRTEQLAEIGGVPDCPGMEDIQLVQRLEKFGRFIVSFGHASPHTPRLNENRTDCPAFHRILLNTARVLGFPIRFFRNLSGDTGRLTARG